MSTPAMPPSTQRRSANGGESSRSNGTPQPSASTSRKRKHVDDLPPAPSQQQQQQHHQHHQQHQQHHLHPSEDDLRPTSSSFPLKRHAGPALTPTPLSPPRPIQTLSPSLAMIVSPTNQDVHTSPRGNQLAPLRNGNSGSPILPPVKSLISGDPRPYNNLFLGFIEVNWFRLAFQPHPLFLSFFTLH
ncbi:hypothetical protein BDZ97DRAFT_1915337 [Flammula alnicola]|nr:hypothetical protein BDZ97DRAFT_1915337 [Flammula alnicola]